MDEIVRALVPKSKDFFCPRVIIGGMEAPPQEQTVKNLVDTLADGTKVKRRLSRQRACNELGEKGKICAGHLKRWYQHSAELAGRFGAEIYRCEHCQTIYLPNPDEQPRTRTLAW